MLKSALLGMVKLLAREFQYDGIRVNGVAPGLIKTKFSEPLWKDEATAEIAKQDMKIDRFGEPSEIAGVIAFLASNDGSYVTGETIIPMGTASARL